MLIWQLTADKELVSFRGTLGDDSIASQTLSLVTNENEWTIDTDVNWLSFDQTSGSGDATITLTTDISKLSTSQLYQGNITLTETTTGDSKTIPVEVGLDNIYLYSSQTAISLAKTLNTEATKQTVTINTNSPKDVAWQAESGADWLLVSRITNSNKLEVSINPEVSVEHGLNQTTITLSAVDNDKVISNDIPVSYYLSSNKTENKVVSELVVNNNALVSSPSLPYIYLAVNNELRVYHQYTAELLETIVVSSEDTLLEQLIIHPEGKWLLAKANETIVNEDETTTIETHRYKITLPDYTITEILDETIEYEPLQYVSFSGRHFIVTQALEYADDDLKRLFLDREGFYLTNLIDQAKNTDAFYALDLSDSSFKRYNAKINDFTNEIIVTDLSHQYRPELLPENSAIRNFILDDNELGIYAISSTSEWISFDGQTFTDNGLLSQGEGTTTFTLDKSTNGRAHYLRFDPTIGFVVNVYNEQAALVATTPTGGLQPSSIELSQDDKRLTIHAANAQQIEIVTVEQIDSSASSLSFSGTLGENEITKQQLTFSGISEDWHAKSNSKWLVLTPSYVDGQAILDVAIDESKVTGWGLFSGTIDITDAVSGNTTTISVELAVDEIRLFANYPAVAFNDQIDKSLLAHTVDVLTNNSTTVQWQAQSNVTWLTLTPDTANNKLLITADPAQITEHGTHYGQITLSPIDETDSLTGVINVSFSKGDFDSTTISEIVIENIEPNTSAIILDPLRPYLYVGQGSKIDVYNVIDGSTVTSIPSPIAATDLTNFVIHPDGSLLLTSNIETYTDENEQQQTRRNYYIVNLTNFSINQLDSENITINSAPEKIVMVSGKPVVVTQLLEFADMSLARQFWNTGNLFQTSVIADVLNNDTVIAYDAANNSLQHNKLEYNAFTEQTVTVKESFNYTNALFANGVRNLATSSNGENIYTVNTISEWSTFDGENFVDQGLLDNNPFTQVFAIKTDSADSSYVYRFDLVNDFFTLSKYDESQQIVWASGYTAGSVDIYLSPNYQRVIHYNSDEKKLVLDYMPN